MDAPARTRWIVLTPSADDAAWRREIERAATAAGLLVVPIGGPAEIDRSDPNLLMLTDDAGWALADDMAQIVAIMPEPESAPTAVAELHGLHPPHSVWHASLLLARAMALTDGHSVISGADLARKPRVLKLFGVLELTPPVSIAEVSRQPAVSAAFNIYRNAREPNAPPVPWSERLFIYDERAARDWSDWGMLDITGRPRMLVWGPYVSLPPGLWRAVIRFGVDERAAGHQYRIDWGTRSDCVSEYVTPGRAGLFEIHLDWLFHDAEAAEIRLILTEGSFMGTLIFQGMTVQRIPSALIASGQAAA